MAICPKVTIPAFLVRLQELVKKWNSAVGSRQVGGYLLLFFGEVPSTQFSFDLKNLDEPWCRESYSIFLDEGAVYETRKSH